METNTKEAQLGFGRWSPTRNLYHGECRIFESWHSRFCLVGVADFCPEIGNGIFRTVGTTKTLSQPPLTTLSPRCRDRQKWPTVMATTIISMPFGDVKNPDGPAARQGSRATDAFTGSKSTPIFLD